MSQSRYDQVRPPERARGRRRRRELLGERAGENRGARQGFLGRQRKGSEGAGEASMVEDVQFSSYYGRPVVKAPPWGHEISAYLFLGGIAGGSGLLSLGAQLTDRAALRRNTRITALTAVGLGTVALVADLGRPERFHHMMRTFKPSSPMNMGTWILSGFGAGIGVAAAVEVDRMTGQKIPLGPLRTVLHAAETPASITAGILAAPLASYTGALLADTAVPTWNASRDHLSAVFASSSCMAAGGIAMVTTGTHETFPARILAGLGVVGETIALHRMKKSMHPAEREPLETAGPGVKLKWAERLALAGGVGAIAAGRWRVPAVISGLMLAGSSALTRFGVLEAGLNSTKDPRHTVEPQKARLEARRAAGITHDSITTAG